MSREQNHQGESRLSARTRVLVVVGCVDGLLSKSDCAAVGQAISKFPGNVFVYSPSHDASAIQYALAAGASWVESLNPEDADIVVLGRGGTEPVGELLAARLALKRKASLVFDVLQFDQIERELEVTRDLGRGTREILTIPFPVVLVMSEESKSPGYISRFRQMRFANVVSERLASLPTAQAAIAIPLRWESTRPRTRASDLLKKTAGSAINRMFNTFGLAEGSTSDSADQQVITGDAETCGSHLVRYLAHHGFVDRRYVPDISDPDPTVDPAARFGLLSSHDSNVDSPADQMTSSRIPDLHDSLSRSACRAPRPLSGALPGMSRRPRPYFHTQSESTKPA